MITVAGGNPYALAAQYLGDATKWYQIAKANGLTDPFFIGLQPLTIPQSTITSNGGVLYHRLSPNLDVEQSDVTIDTPSTKTHA